MNTPSPKQLLKKAEMLFHQALDAWQRYDAKSALRFAVRCRALLAGPKLRKNAIAKRNLPLVTMNIALYHIQLFEHAEALPYLVSAIGLMEKEEGFLTHGEVDQDYVACHANLVACYLETGDLKQAESILAKIENDIQLRRIKARGGRSECTYEGQIYLLRHTISRMYGDTESAKLALNHAINIAVRISSNTSKLELVDFISQCLLAEALVDGDFQTQALPYSTLKDCVAWIRGLPPKERDVRRLEWSIMCMEIALAAVGSADFSEAISWQIEGSEILDPVVGQFKPRIWQTYFGIQQFGAFLLPYQADWQLWSRDKSGRLVDIIDLAPADDVEPWSSMRGNFSAFHANWLRFSLSEQGYAPEVIPEILSAIQGRTLVAEVLETALAGDGDAPEPVRMLAEHKQRMREVLEQIREEGEMGLTAGMLGVGAPGGMRGVGFERQWVPKPSEKSQEELRSELQRLRDELSKLKEKAASEPGYEILDAPHTQITTERLQAVLGDGEALALAFTHGGDGTEPLAGEETPDLSEKGYVFVLRHSGQPELITCPELSGLATRFEQFTESLPAGRMRRGAWDVRGPEGLPSGGATEVPKAERLSPEEMESFWEDQSQAMRETLWDPLVESGVLKGADRILLATAGDLHNLPFEPGREAAGAPEMVHVNSLAMFALGRGLYKQTGTGKATNPARSVSEPALPARRRAAMLCWPGERGAKDYLGFARAERDAVEALWAEALGDDGVVSAASHPWQPNGDVDLLHVACHGAVLKEEDRTPRPMMQLEPDGEGDSGLVGEREYLRGPKAREVLMNICVGGQVFDDSFDGNPTGLVAGALRHGAHTVVASLPPVPDEHGYVFGVLVTLLMTKRGLSLAAATGVAKRVMAGAPRESDEAQDLIRQLSETRARLLFPLIALSPEDRHKKLDALMQENSKRTADPGLTWLTRDLAARILAEPPDSLDDLTNLIAGTTPIVSDKARSPAADGIITYGITIFGDPEGERNVETAAPLQRINKN